jgi:tRNA(adenine34) deaminase
VNDPTDVVVTDDEAMALALEEAQAALAEGEVPVGAVVLHAGTVVARRHNEREQRQDPTAHAEVLALQDAAASLGTWRLVDCTLVVTLEPCIMCAGALLAARIGRLVYGAADLKGGATASLYNVLADPRVNHNPPVSHGVRAEDSTALLTAFFTDRRGNPSGAGGPDL